MRALMPDSYYALIVLRGYKKCKQQVIDHHLDSILFFSRSTTSRKITNTKRNTTIQKKNKPLLDKLL